MSEVFITPETSPEDLPEYLTIHQVAQYLGCRDEIAYGLVGRGVVPLSQEKVGERVVSREFFKKFKVVRQGRGKKILFLLREDRPMRTPEELLREWEGKDDTSTKI